MEKVINEILNKVLQALESDEKVNMKFINDQFINISEAITKIDGVLTNNKLNPILDLLDSIEKRFKYMFLKSERIEGVRRALIELE